MPEQFVLFAHAKDNESALKRHLNFSKQKSHNDMEIPEIKIMAKRWPVKQIKPVKEIAKS